jgi:hypothetical protein
MFPPIFSTPGNENKLFATFRLMLPFAFPSIIGASKFVSKAFPEKGPPGVLKETRDNFKNSLAFPPMFEYFHNSSHAF